MLKLLPFSVLNHRLFSSIPSEIKLINFERKLTDCTNLEFKQLVSKVHTDEKMRLIFQIFFEKNQIDLLLQKEVQERLVTEFDVFLNHKEDYLLDFLLHYEDFAHFFESQNKISNFGRGSSTGSLTNYLLRITKVNPLEYGLLFERWINKVDAPDIDMDTPDSKAIQEYIQKKHPMYYTKVKVEHKWKIKTLLSESRIILGLSIESKKILNEIITKYEELFLQSSSPNAVKTQLALFKFILEHNASFSLIFSNNLDIKEMFFKKLDTVERIREHPVAFVLSDTENLLMNELEDSGVVKFDVLQLTSLSELNAKMNLTAINLNQKFDPKVLTKLTSPNREQVGLTRDISLCFPNFKVDSILDVAILIAKSRQNNIVIQEFLLYKGENPIIIKNLLETSGEVVFQEQLMHIFSEGMSINLFDSRGILRKASKGIISEDEKFKESFSESDQIFLKNASRYAFVKSHAVAYAMMDYFLFK